MEQSELDGFVARCKEASRNATTLQDLSDALGVARSTVRDRLRKAGYKPPYLDSLRSELSLESLADADVLVRQASYLKRVVKRLKQKLADRGWLRDEVAGQIAVQEPIAVQPPVYEGPDKQEQVALLECSDPHYGLKVGADILGPLFTGYDTDVAKARMLHAFSTFTRLAHQQSFPVRKAVIYCLGDLIEGSHMRPSQAQYTSVHVVKQTVEMANILAACFTMVCSQFEEVEVQAIPGNHSRTTQKAGENAPDETFEHLMHHLAKAKMGAQPNLKYVVNDSWYFLHSIYGYKFLGLHGDDCRGWAGVPFYGIQRMIKDYAMLGSMATKQTLRRMRMSDTMTVEDVLELLHMPDYACLGHFHTPMLWALMGIDILANGAMCGSSVYSAKRLHTATPPRQKMMFVHPDHGVGLRMDIDLENVT